MVANMNWTSPKSENDAYCEESFLPPQSGASSSSVLTQSSGSNVTVNMNEASWPWGELHCQPNSHHFTKRTLLLNRPVKIGRAVAQIKAAPDNAIFDCKVLSRHHACLWYEDGHFYLKDTKSSNGTFVNNNKLSSGKDSKPYEVCSGDIVQFGVDIVDNVSRVIHACIIATLKLYSPDCKQTKGQSGGIESTFHLDDLYVLNKYLQEALQREHILDGKLNSLMRVVDVCREAALNSWHALVSEERLLGRIQFLERSLEAYSNNEEPNKLCQEIDSKYQYQLNATEALRVAHEKHVSLLKKVESLQLSISSSENECSVLRNQSDLAYKELQELCAKCMSTEESLAKAQSALATAEQQLEYEKKKVANLNAKENKRAELGIDNINEINNWNPKTQDNNTYNDHMDNSDLSLSQSLKLNSDNSDAVDISLPDAVKHTPDYNFFIEIHVKDLSQKITLFIQELKKLHEELKSEDNLKIFGAIYNNCDVQKCLRSIFSNSDISLNNCNSPNNTQDDSNLNKDTECDYEKIFANNESKQEFINNEIKDVLQLLESWHEEILVTNVGSRKNKEKNYTIDNHVSDHSNDNTLEKNDNDTSTICLKNDEEENAHIIIREVSVKLLKNMLLSAQNHIAKLYRDLAKVRHDMSVADIAQKTINKYFDQELQEVRTTNSNLIDTLEEKEQLCKDLSKKLLEYEEKKDCSNCKEELEKHEKAMEAIKTENHKEIENLQRSIIQKNQEISKLAEIQVDLEGKLNQMSVEKEQMKIEQEEKKLSNNLHESNSLQNHTKVSNVTETCKKSVISSSLSAGNLIWDSSDPTELSVDLKKMSELEEELIETKEKWARLNEDKTELASQLQNMTDKYNKMAQRSFMDILMYIVPMAVVLLYVLIHPYIS